MVNGKWKLLAFHLPFTIYYSLFFLQRGGARRASEVFSIAITDAAALGKRRGVIRTVLLWFTARRETTRRAAFLMMNDE